MIAIHIIPCFVRKILVWISLFKNFVQSDQRIFDLCSKPYHPFPLISISQYVHIASLSPRPNRPKFRLLLKQLIAPSIIPQTIKFFFIGTFRISTDNPHAGWNQILYLLIAKEPSKSIAVGKWKGPKWRTEPDPPPRLPPPSCAGTRLDRVSGNSEK